MRHFALLPCALLTACIGGEYSVENDAGVDANSDTATSDASSSSDASPGVDGDTSDLAHGITPMFVVGGQDQRHLVSMSGSTWEHDTYVAPNGNDNAFYAVAIGAGRIVLAGDSGIVTSTDGQAWSPASTTVSGGLQFHSSRMIYAGGRFVLVAGSRVATSTDGVTWTVQDDSNGEAGHWHGLAFGNGHYLAFGDDVRKVSEDGLSWHDVVRYPSENDTPRGIAFGAGKFVATFPTQRRHMETTDGVTWTNDITENDSDFQDWNSIAYGNGKFVAVNCCRSFTSLDGTTWTKHSGGGVDGSIVFLDGKFVGAGWRTQIKTSTDGESFTSVFTDAATNMFDPSELPPWFTGIGAGYL